MFDRNFFLGAIAGIIAWAGSCAVLGRPPVVRPLASRARYELVVSGGALYRVDTWSGAVETCTWPGGAGSAHCELAIRPVIGE